jgi:8-oxo-dGTP pyrophosphatase MutT (NUDIX family)
MTKNNLNNSSGIFIFNYKNELLICHPTGGRHDTNWSIPKGQIDKNETTLEAAVRETLEETNIDLSDVIYDIKYVGTQQYEKLNKSLISYVYKFNENIKFDLKCNSFVSEFDEEGNKKWNGGKPENDVIKFVSIKEATNLLHEAQIKLLKSIKI